MEKIGKKPVVYWDKKVPDTNHEKFQKIVEKNHNVKFESYWDFHKWSVENYAKYIEELWHFFGIIASKPYEKVWIKTGPGFLDNEWFSGARLNYAENMLRIRDETIAFICLDELGNEEIVTYAKLYEEVKHYAAAFRKNGLKKGDTVACFMPNRKEPIFAMLAATSIGAIWGGAAPYYGARVASNVISTMDPKFLITIDSHQDNFQIYPTLNYLPEIIKNSPTIEKVILVVTQEEKRKMDLSYIRNCVFLEDFLQDALDPTGNIPELIFEQLPFDYPLCVNFTSGTTGVPKASVHSIGTMMAIMQNHSIIYNMKKGDIVCMPFPVGWIMWNIFIPCLGLGMTFFLYCGSFYATVKGKNFWDLVGEYQCKQVTLITGPADKMDKLDIVPSKGTDMSCLKVVLICGSCVRNHHFDYIKNKVNKDALVTVLYGSTEIFGPLSAFEMNMPIYGGEIQVPGLGMDLQCFDSEGKPVIGKIGETVLCNPLYHLPIHLWKDVNKAKLTDIYLKKFPGVWTQHDECWINPKTKGIVIIGRSDETLKQNSKTFGAADIYFAIHAINELQDYICVPQQKYNGDSRAVLFVKMHPGLKLTPEIRRKIEKTIEEQFVEDYVPEIVLEVPDIPYNFNNKRMETLVRNMIARNEIPEAMNIRNPECLKHYVNIPEIVSHNEH